MFTKFKTIQSPIILLSPGRSGSTLLQRIINTSDDIVMWGEHNGILSGIAESYNNILYSKELDELYYSRLSHINSSLIKNSYVNYPITINWLNSFDKEETKKLYRSFIYSLLNQKGITKRTFSWGFKEIRYSVFDPTINMFVDLFPKMKLILSVRNPTDIISSMLLAFYPKEYQNIPLTKNESETIKKRITLSAERVKKTFISFGQWNKDPNVDTIIIKYEDLITKKDETIKMLFTFLNRAIPTNAFEPLNFRLSNTQNLEFRSVIDSMVIEEKENIWKIIGDVPNTFGYFKTL